MVLTKEQLSEFLKMRIPLRTHKLKHHLFTKENIEIINYNSDNHRFYMKGNKVYGMDLLDPRSGYQPIDGYYLGYNIKTAYFTKSVVRNAKFSTCFSKGTYFHEYQHLHNFKEDIAYMAGYLTGGTDYYDVFSDIFEYYWGKSGFCFK